MSLIWYEIFWFWASEEEFAFPLAQLCPNLAAGCYLQYANFHTEDEFDFGVKNAEARKRFMTEWFNILQKQAPPFLLSVTILLIDDGDFISAQLPPLLTIFLVVILRIWSDGSFQADTMENFEQRFAEKNRKEQEKAEAMAPATRRSPRRTPRPHDPKDSNVHVSPNFWLGNAKLTLIDVIYLLCSCPQVFQASEITCFLWA
jgi:hypothetical protein